ncbi:MAG: Na+/H+ antiporter NhaC family protein [Gemmatimonadota bacterium]|nr:Na+/H+ antiporter NhaC family protein [Gemmatimonadota bacterium]
MPFLRLITALWILLLPANVGAQELLDPPSVILTDVPFELTLQGANQALTQYEVRSATGLILAEGTILPQGVSVVTGLEIGSTEQLPLEVLIGDHSDELDPTLIPGWFSVLPPILAILLALIFREVITALFAGVWLGALAVAGFNPLKATGRLIDQFVVPALTNADHVAILVFSLLLGGMVGIIARNGGTMGIVESVTPFARSARRGKIATWAAGLAIFFDDYANTLIVGNTMRPITDRLRISREKLAYIVDSTAAPVAALVPISTWVGYEISLISDGLRIAAEQNPNGADVILSQNPFDLFLQTIPFLFYPLLAVIFVLMTSVMNRDFGPMAEAELRAATKGELHKPGATLATDTSSELMSPKKGLTYRWWNAAFPVLTVIVVVLAGLYTTGRTSVGPDASLREVFAEADPFSTLLWGSLAGCLVAILISIGQRMLTVQECIDAWLGGMKAMMIAMIILTLAWSLGSVTEAIGTAQYLSLLLSDRVSLQLIPLIVFVTCAAMAFATGTSWGTMAIMLPLVIPLTVSLGGAATYPGGDQMEILLGATASVLAGAIFGDHCSPISDTTILSSTASACDHMDHVRTQLPYAVLVGLIGMLLGNVGTAYGLPPWGALLGGVFLLFLFLQFRGRVVSGAD